MKKIRFGILGCGYIATKMAEAVKYLENNGHNIETYAVASRDEKKAAAFAEEYGFAKSYGSYEELANDSSVDLVYVATPHSHHFENAKLCIEKGKNVLVEKAFAANTKQASAIVALAEEKGVLLVEAMWTRFLPAVSLIKNIIAEGTIGDVLRVEGDFSIPLTHVERLCNPALAGGALLDLGIYPLTFADLFLDGEIAKVESTCVKYETGVDATDYISISYKNGQHAELKTSFVSYEKNEGTIFGTKGSIKVMNLNDFAEVLVYDAACNLKQSIKPERMVNCYEYEVLACIKALENPAEFKRVVGNRTIWECPEITHEKTLDMMSQMDQLRENWGVWYPFEIPASVTWNRSNDKSILQTYDVETGNVTVLKEFDCVIEAPNWSSDGSYLAYNSNGRIYKYELSTGEISEVPSYYVDNCNNDHVLAPDGSGLYVSHHTKEDGLSRIYKIFFDGRMPQLVTPLAPSYLHGITPDGKTLAYCAERGGEYDIYTIPAIGGNETRLTTAKGLNDGPEYDAEGEYIWFNSVRSGRMQAYCMKADGSEQTQITDDLHLNTWFPHISPNRKLVVAVAYYEDDVKPGEHVPNKNVELRLIALENGKWGSAKTILKLFGGQGTINVNSWSPDSKKFAFVSYAQK